MFAFVLVGALKFQVVDSGKNTPIGLLLYLVFGYVFSCSWLKFLYQISSVGSRLP
jgi:hypothetical protein